MSETKPGEVAVKPSEWITLAEATVQPAVCVIQAHVSRELYRCVRIEDEDAEVLDLIRGGIRFQGQFLDDLCEWLTSQRATRHLNQQEQGELATLQLKAEQAKRAVEVYILARRVDLDVRLADLARRRAQTKS